MVEKLANCPFCGGKAKLMSYRTSEDSMGCHIHCISCDARTTEFEDAYTPSADASDAWNRRDLTASLVEENERLRGLLSESQDMHLRSVRRSCELRDALEKIASLNQVREFTGSDKNDGYGDGGWITYDGQYAKIARAALGREGA